MAKVRQREITENIAVVFTATGSEDLTDWCVESIDRKRGVNGHGSHFLVLRDGQTLETRDRDTFGNLIWHLDDDTVYIRMVGDKDALTDEQEEALDRLRAELEHAYPNAEFFYADAE
ncbi:N-acetylmuramoyl-L-alanine amidase [Salinivibrio kushneri]|uniref:N-acetylmuramoyl-L-alanine amidase n=1 Tax=Salinivibrio kushneri TaxID=1908198 RepID=UPI000988F1FF|nr:N-acetylmuramoyl-L-alanine amidase [Salinivibrio kushneri]